MQQNTSKISGKRILVAALNWGLGHAARCVPLIHQLQADGHQVVLAADGRAGLLLQKEFISLPYIELPAYNIRYGSSNMVLNMAWQWPKILSAGLREHRKIKKIVTQYQIDIIISDNRFGCYHPSTKNIFITHQLWIRTPSAVLSFVVNQINHWMIRRFEECWVPDWSEKPRLAGGLSRPIPNQPHRYLGPLSRLRRVVEEKHEASYPLVAILSGPEPQRSKFEHLIIQQAKQLNQPLLLIQGKTEVQVIEKREGTITVQAFASGAELNAILLKAEVVLCRSGYSSIMDLVSLGKPAILVPTPGQTEQEYLARVCQDKGWFYTQAQDQFDLQKALAAYSKYHPSRAVRENSQENLKEAVRMLAS